MFGKTPARADDFSSFREVLGKMFVLKRAQADALGYTGSPYDALLDDYEPDESTANVARVLAELRDALVPLVAAIGRQPPIARRNIWRGIFPRRPSSGLAAWWRRRSASTLAGEGWT